MDNNLSQKINELSGAIKKEQYRMRNAGEECSREHADFLDNLIFSLFDLEAALKRADISVPEDTKKTVIEPRIPVGEVAGNVASKVIEAVKEVPSQATFAAEDMAPVVEKLVEEVKPEVSQNFTSNTDNAVDEFFKNQTEESSSVDEEEPDLFPGETITPVEESTEIPVEEEPAEEINPEELNEIERVLGRGSISVKQDDFTYCFKKFSVTPKKGGQTKDMFVYAAPMLESKEDCVSVPIMCTVVYEGRMNNLCSVDGPLDRPSLDISIYDFNIKVRGIVEKGQFNISVTSPDITLQPIMQDTHTNIGKTFKVLHDKWEDLDIYAFPLDLQKAEFAIISKSPDFIDYANVTGEHPSTPIQAYQGDIDKTKTAMLGITNEDGTYEFEIQSSF